jgi:hypothetical protein
MKGVMDMAISGFMGCSITSDDDIMYSEKIPGSRQYVLRQYTTAVSRLLVAIHSIQVPL